MNLSTCFQKDTQLGYLEHADVDHGWMTCIFSSPGQSSGRAVVLPLASALVAALALVKC